MWVGTEAGTDWQNAEAADLREQQEGKRYVITTEVLSKEKRVINLGWPA
jgi:hypothetical protein